MSLITVSNVSKQYKTYTKEKGLSNSIKGLFRREYVVKEALHDISFQIEEGEIVGYLGPNGSGKSTTLKILSGLLYPTTGEVTAAGFVPWERKEEYKKIFSIVMGQKGQLWWDIPAIDSFELFRAIYGVEMGEYRKTVKELAELLNAEDIMTRPVRTLSLGERMKLELIGAFLHKPKIMYLDEPTIGLDFLSQKSIREFIKKVNKDEKVAIMLTSHNLKDVEELCDRVIIINEGNKVYDDSISRLRSMGNKKKLVSFTAVSEEGLEVLSEYGRVEKTGFGEFQVEVPEALIREFNGRILENSNITNYKIEEGIERVIERIYQSK